MIRTLQKWNSTDVDDVSWIPSSVAIEEFRKLTSELTDRLDRLQQVQSYVSPVQEDIISWIDLWPLSRTLSAADKLHYARVIELSSLRWSKFSVGKTIEQCVSAADIDLRPALRRALASIGVPD